MSNSDTTINKEFSTGWRMVRLGDAIEEIKNGFASGKRDEKGIVQIRMNNVTTDGRLIFDSYLKVPVPENTDYWLLKKGDLLFNNTNSIDLVGKSTIFNNAPFPCTFSNHFTRIRFKKEKVLPELILYHFITLWEKGYFKSVAIRHVGQSAVHTDYLLKLQIPLSPLPEQRRIADVLGTVDSAILKGGGAIERTERLKRGLMQRLLTRGIGHERFKESEVGRVPEEWGVVKLGDVTENVKRGPFGGSIKKEIFVPSGYKIYEQKNVIDNDFNIGSYYIDEKKFEELKSFAIKEGDILITGAGTIGKIAIVPKEFKPGIINQALIKITLNKNKILLAYFSNLLNYEIFRNEILGFSHGATMKNISSIKNFKSIKIPLPPLPEQRRIAEILSAADRKLELERRRKEKLERVKKGLMNELLTGRKRVIAEMG